MAVPVNYFGEAKSFDSFLAPNLEWRHLEVSQRSSSFSHRPISPPAPSFVHYLRCLLLTRLGEGFFAPTQAGALRLALTGVGCLQEFIRGLLRLLTSCSPFTDADEGLTRTVRDAARAAAISILTFNTPPLVPALSP